MPARIPPVHTSPSTIGEAPALARYLRWRRVFEALFWIAFFGSGAIGNTLTLLIDVERVALDLSAWEPATWEASSAIASLLLMPALAWFCARWPLHWDTWQRRLPLYVLVSVAWSLAHVALMVAMRKLTYAAYGLSYEFGHWPTELYYEFLKDARTFTLVVMIVHGYRLILRRAQGEASLLSPPDDGPPLEPVERPERFLVRKLGREFLVAADDIEWAQSAGNYVSLRVRGRDYPLRSTISGLAARLDPQRFARVHRSHLVNLDRLVSIEPMESGDARLHMADGSTLPCSRRYRDALRGS